MPNNYPSPHKSEKDIPGLIGVARESKAGKSPPAVFIGFVVRYESDLLRWLHGGIRGPYEVPSSDRLITQASPAEALAARKKCERSPAILNKSLCQ